MTNCFIDLKIAVNNEKDNKSGMDFNKIKYAICDFLLCLYGNAQAIASINDYKLDTLAKQINIHTGMEYFYVRNLIVLCINCIRRSLCDDALSDGTNTDDTYTSI